jgi:hypothetical protein
MDLKQLLKEVLRDNEEMYSKVCTVESVNGLICDCVPVDGSAPILEVRLTTNDEAENYFAVIPKVGSQIIVTFLTKDVAFVSMVTDPEKVIYKNGDLVFEATEKFLIKKGDNSLKDVLTLIIQACSQIMVMQGNNPDFVKLQQALNKTQNLFQ